MVAEFEYITKKSSSAQYSYTSIFSSKAVEKQQSWHLSIHLTMKWKLRVTHPWKNEHPGGLIKVEDMLEKNRPPLQNCSPALLPCFCFQHQSYYEFCQKVASVQFHHELARLFVLHLHGDQVVLAGVTFTLTPKFVSLGTGILNIGEPWHKKQKIDGQHYEQYIKTGFLRQIKRVFPFRYLKDEYSPLMKLIMKYFSCEGRFSCLYAYHIRLLMHFTRVRMMNIPYSFC